MTHVGELASKIRENNSLKTVDIAGANPKQSNATKNFSHYGDKLADNTHPNVDAGFRYDTFDPYQSQKKHYDYHHQSEINRYGIMNTIDQHPKDTDTFDYPRNLSTKDIPGAAPGTLTSKAVKNQDLHSKIISSQNRHHEDSLDKFKNEYHVNQAYQPRHAYFAPPNHLNTSQPNLNDANNMMPNSPHQGKILNQSMNIPSNPYENGHPRSPIQNSSKNILDHQNLQSNGNNSTLEINPRSPIDPRELMGTSKYRHFYSPDHKKIAPISEEMISRQRQYDTQLHNYKKNMSYNILTNKPYDEMRQPPVRIPRGYFIAHDPGRLEAFTNFHLENSKVEQQKMENHMNIFFGHEPTNDVPKPGKRYCTMLFSFISKRGYNIDHPENYFAGKSSFYGETNYRYANRASFDHNNPTDQSDAPKIYGQFLQL